MTHESTGRKALAPNLVERRRRAPRFARNRYEELMLDEAIDETFPASDPPASSYPGSSLYEMAQDDRARHRHLVKALSVGALLVVAGLLFGRARRNDTGHAAS